VKQLGKPQEPKGRPRPTSKPQAFGFETSGRSAGTRT